MRLFVCELSYLILFLSCTVNPWGLHLLQSLRLRQCLVPIVLPTTSTPSVIALSVSASLKIKKITQLFTATILSQSRVPGVVHENGKLGSMNLMFRSVEGLGFSGRRPVEGSSYPEIMAKADIAHIKATPPKLRNKTRFLPTLLLLLCL